MTITALFSVEALVGKVLAVVWSPYLVVLCLLAGLYFSIRTRFIQLRALPDMLRLMFRHERSGAGISPFQALSLSLSSRVGVGNIAGVAMAIAFGGPGAIFWMWIVAFLGASSAFIESTLAQIYKGRDAHGQYRGGPAYYIEKGLGQRWYAVLFALVTVLAGALLAGTQSNAIASAVNEAWDVPARVTAGVLLAVLAVIVFGGVRRIARVAEWVIPLMAVAYLLVAALVMVLNIDKVPEVIALVLRSAFGVDAAFGAMIGTAIQWGVRRGVLSNEAGMGSGAHPAAAAEVSHPVKQGLVQAFSVYIDTMIVCSATAFLILSTGLYNVYDPAVNGVPDEARLLLGNLPGVEAGPRFVQYAVESALPGFGRSFVALAILPFAFTTILALYYMAETNISYLCRDRPGVVTIGLFQLLFLAATGYSAVNSATVAWSLGDIGVGLMSWLNIIAILLLQKPALVALRDYEAHRRKGRDPQFRPGALGLRNTRAWEG
ncbi:alanine/glycine:cation symporter family protein [Stenotrophomonas sp. 24(2023)]|uniref:alanine/glycine:cation symporter family protein n=1 Tax=Stenotrophomonas sp. 24(2023) TaxID=3068324 RepID=UPI0027DFBA4B|nr:alanine/glycine:cation symporter family protein [Stenotrophomonas sp. 24(2023)]WMJ70309.1 alanine/glycine:cation symporter family protein [Stenotrophomonas sp. 24(2023)]